MVLDITIAGQPIVMRLESDFWQILFTITGVATAGITAFFLWYQIRKQTKVNSAQLSLELIKRVRDKDFAEIVDQIFDGKSSICDAITLERFLNHFDMIAKFNEDKLLDIKHITQIYGGLLKKIKLDNHIQEILNENDGLFQPLIRLYNKIED